MGLPNGPVFYVIALDQQVIHRRTRIINVKGQLSRSLEPTTHQPRRIANGFKVQVEEKLKESYRKLSVEPIRESHVNATH